MLNTFIKTFIIAALTAVLTGCPPGTDTSQFNNRNVYGNSDSRAREILSRSGQGPGTRAFDQLPDVNKIAKGATKPAVYCENCVHLDRGADAGKANGYVAPVDTKVIDDDKICSKYDKIIKNNPDLPEEALKQTLRYLMLNKDKFKKQDEVSIADYTAHSGEKRFFIVNLKTGKVDREHVSHGGGKGRAGDPEHDGMMNKCSTNGGDQTNFTRPGFFSTEGLAKSPSHSGRNESMKKAGNKRASEWPALDDEGNRKLILEGLVTGVNDHAKDRHVVMHGSWYNDYVGKSGQGTMGRSYGCPAFEFDRAGEIINRLKGGGLYYSYTGENQCGKFHKKIKKEIPGWEGMCGVNESDATEGVWTQEQSAKAQRKATNDDAGLYKCARGVGNILADQGYPIQRGHAHTWAGSLSRIDGWQEISCKPSSCPAGAVMVFDRNDPVEMNGKGAQYGHVEIVTTKTDGSRTYCSDKCRSNYGGSVINNKLRAFIFTGKK